MKKLFRLALITYVFFNLFHLAPALAQTSTASGTVSQAPEGALTQTPAGAMKNIRN